MNRLNIFCSIVVLFSFFQFGCGNDNSAAPLPTGTITGEITFVGTLKPDGDIKVQLWRNWPPSGDPFLSIDFGNASGKQAYSFENLPLATYQAVTVDWLVPDNPSQNRIIGVYWANSDSVGTAGTIQSTQQPSTIILSANNIMQENIDIKADHGLVN
ncbi:MAG: hypothetical protein ACE5I1_02805 [bacterium]